MNKINKWQLIALLLILFTTLSYKTYEQYIDLQNTQKLLILNESESLAIFIASFRKTYQEAFVSNHIEVTDKTMKLLPVQTISEISQKFSSRVHGDIVIRTVSDNPRNPQNLANNFELDMMEYFKSNPTKLSNFIQKDDGYYYTSPLYIEESCLKCHGKREDALPSIAEKYSTAYDYKLGDLRGLLNIKIKKRELFNGLYRDLITNAIIAVIMFLVSSMFIYILIKKIATAEHQYTQKLLEEVDEKTKEIKKQNLAFEILFEKSSDGILIIEDSKFVQCNEAIVKMLGYDSKEDLLNLHPSELSPEYQPDGKLSLVKANMMMNLAIENGSHSFEWVHLRSDDKEFWTEVTLTPMSLINREIIHVTWKDISLRKELEQRVKLHTQELEVHNKNLDLVVKQEIQKNEKNQKILFEQSRMAQMGEMISMIAHQWRQPLGAISSTSIDLSMKLELELFDIETQDGREEAQKYFYDSLKQIDSLVQSLTTTIDDFRNFYKPDKSKEISNVNIAVQKAVGIVEATMKSNNIEILYDTKSEVEIELYLNEFMQVILNILQNSSDNFLSKKITLAQITVKTYDTQDSTVVEILDNGEGIADDIIGKIFDPYFSTKSEKNGTGLGLYMSKKIVEEHHNGIITANNIEDGICFKIELFKEEKSNGN